MSKHIVEETPEKGSHAQGDNPVEKQASQLAYDVKYKVKQAMNKGTKMNPAQVAKAYQAQLAKSPAPPAVKALAKKKLLGEEHISDVASLAEKAVVNAMVKVFSEQIDEKKYKVRVTDKKTGNTYVRNATRAKIAELRANPNISSVEMTSYGEVSDDEKSKGTKTAKAKAGKDYDGDGKVESGAKEYRGAVHNAIQRKKGGKADGQDTSSVKEEVIYEKEEKTEKKDKVITGEKVNNYNGKDAVVKLFPNLGEQSEVQEPDATKQNQRKQLSTLQQFQNKERQLNQQKLAAQKSGKVPVGSLHVDSYEPEGEQIDEKAVSKAQQRFMGMVYAAKKGETPASPEVEKAASGMSEKEAKKFAKTKHDKLPEKVAEEKEGCGCGKTPCECGKEDERELSTKAALFKNKLRAKGIKVAGITPTPRNMKTADELGESAEDRARDEHQMRGGMAARVDYNRPPAKKLSNAELGIKPGKTAVQKELEKKHGKGKTAIDIVKADIRSKHGKGSIKD